MNHLKSFLTDEQGAELAEYAVGTAILVAVAIIVFVVAEFRSTRINGFIIIVAVIPNAAYTVFPHVIGWMWRSTMLAEAVHSVADTANQAFVKPTIANWGDDKLSDYAVGFIAEMGWPGVKHICRSGFAGRAPAEDYPLSNRFDEVDTLIVFDDVLVPWENVLFYRHTRAAIGAGTA